MHRQSGDVDVVAGDDDFLHRRVGARQLDEFGLQLQPSLQLLPQLASLDAEGPRQSLAAADRVADEFDALAADVAEPDGLLVALQDFGDLGEVDALVADIELIRVDQLLDEVAQAKAVEVVLLRVRSLGVHGHILPVF